VKKLAIITTHPIQYYAPWFAMLSERNKLILKVFYTFSQWKNNFVDKGFLKEVKWDIPLLENYDYEFVENTSKKPDLFSFFGIENKNLNSKISEYNPDAILFIGWNYASHLGAMRYFHGKKKIWFRGDSTLLDENFGIKKFLRRLFLKRVYNYVDTAFYVGQNNKNYFLAHNLKEKNLVFAPHAIDNERFSKNEKEFETLAQKWREELNIPQNSKTILFAGKFENKKNPLFIIQAAKDLPDFTFILTGDGELKKKLLSESLPNLVFLPFQNQTQMPILYRLANIFVLPSKGPGETWGLAINEAMACKRAVLVSNKCGCAIDLVKNNENGFIFNFDDYSDFLTKLKILLHNSDLKLFGNNSSKIIKNWSFQKICETIELKINEK
jgi:glycosyltransferase involved in cell wall biosynthesis